MLRSAFTLNRTACRNDPDMKHETNRKLLPTLAVPAGRGVELVRRKKSPSNAFGVRLF